MPSLAEYANTAGAYKPGPRCTTCCLPEVDEINAAMREGRVKLPAILRWLTDHLDNGGRGYDAGTITHSKLSHHKFSGHHLDNG